MALTLSPKIGNHKKVIIVKFIEVLAILVLLSFSSFSQTNVPDTVILVSSKILVGNVKGLSSSKISFVKQGSSQVQEISRKQIHKIKFSNGRVEKFNNLAFQMLDETNYQAVIITENPADVEGLYEYGKVEAKSGKSSRTAKSAEKNARIRIQRRAAAMGALYVLITKSETRGGYKEVPTHFIEGIAYGIEPPKEKKE